MCARANLRDHQQQRHHGLSSALPVEVVAWRAGPSGSLLDRLMGLAVASNPVASVADATAHPTRLLVVLLAVAVGSSGGKLHATSRQRHHR
jgi:hypothetical protein